jgi:hypothetical protein
MLALENILVNRYNLFYLYISSVLVNYLLVI